MKWRDFVKRNVGESDNDYVLRLLRQLLDHAHDFLNECNGHPAVLLLEDKEAHIKEMWREWRALNGTWNAEKRPTEEFMDKLCDDIRKKPIRTHGKIYPLKCVWDLAYQQNRLYAMTRPGSERRKRIDAIFNRYYANIEATQEWKDAFEDGYSYVTGDPMNWNLPQECYDPIAKTAGYGTADHVKFPRSVYAAK